MTALKEKIWRTQCFILSDEDAVAFGVDLCVASNFAQWGAKYIPDKTKTNEVIVAYAKRNQKALCGLLNELRNSVSGSSNKWPTTGSMISNLTTKRSYRAMILK